MIPLGVMASGRVAPVATANLADAILALAPTHYYRMAAGSGSTLADSGSGGLPATLAGTYTWGAGLTPNDPASIDFTAGYARTGAAVASAAHLTALALIRPSTVSGNDNILQHEVGGGANIRFRMRLSNGVPQIIMNVGGIKTASGPSALAANTTYLVAGTYDGTAIRMYVNGTQVGAVTIAGAAMSRSDPIAIGAYTTAFVDPFDGRIAHASYWTSTALSAAQILALAQTAGVA